MRRLTRDRKYWIDDDFNGNFNVGLTDEGLAELGSIITCAPQTRANVKVEAGEKLFSVETHRCLQPLRSPVAGKIIYIRREVEDDPTGVDTTTILVTLRDVDARTL